MVMRFAKKRDDNYTSGLTRLGHGLDVEQDEEGLTVLKLEGQRYLGALPADPHAPEEGDLWFNTASGAMRVRTGGVTYQSPRWNPVSFSDSRAEQAR